MKISKVLRKAAEFIAIGRCQAVAEALSEVFFDRLLSGKSRIYEPKDYEPSLYFYIDLFEANSGTHPLFLPPTPLRQEWKVISLLLAAEVAERRTAND